MDLQSQKSLLSGKQMTYFVVCSLSLSSTLQVALLFICSLRFDTGPCLQSHGSRATKKQPLLQDLSVALSFLKMGRTLGKQVVLLYLNSYTHLPDFWFPNNTHNCVTSNYFNNFLTLCIDSDSASLSEPWLINVIFLSEMLQVQSLLSKNLGCVLEIRLVYLLERQYRAYTV